MLENQFTQIIGIIQASRSRAITAVNTELIKLYWKIGGYISLQLQKSNWGEKTVGELATYIKRYHPEIKGFNRLGLYRMKRFYETYASSTIVSSVMIQLQNHDNEQHEIVSPIMTQLELTQKSADLLTKVSWTHHLTIMSRCQSEEEREFYIRLCILERYSVRELERQINSGIFERTMLGAQLPLSLKENFSNIAHNFKDSYIFEFLNLQEPYKENDLQKALLSQMKSFVLELGKDFLFVGEEFKLQVGNSDFSVDLLFFHRGLQCLIAFELKNDNFKPEHLGQLNFYLEALDRNIKRENENPSIGILLCKNKEKEVVEYALNRSLSPALVSQYKLQLPDKGLLQQKLHELFEEQ